jgi:hypothetical protein
VCVGEIIFIPWFSKDLKMTYRRTTGFMASSLYFLFANQYSLGGGFPFAIVLVPRYKLSLCRTESRGEQKNKKKPRKLEKKNRTLKKTD